MDSAQHQVETPSANSEDVRKSSEMELSLALERSKSKECGVCLDVVLEKPVSERTFGILENCNHCYCFDCISKWRNVEAPGDRSQIVTSCPECRTPSKIVCPSKHWVDGKEAKEALIEQYKIMRSCFSSGTSAEYRPNYTAAHLVPRYVIVDTGDGVNVD